MEAEDAEGTLYNRTVKALDAYLTPMDMHLHYAVLFMSQSKSPEESNEHFIRNLRELVSRCSGWDQLRKEDMMRIRLLAGMRDKDLSRKLEINDSITLDQIKQQLRTKEIIALNQKTELDKENQVLVVKSKQSTERTQRGSNNKGQAALLIRDSKYCGRDNAKGCCPAYNKSCDKCQTIGHFAKVCKKSQNAKPVTRSRCPRGTVLKRVTLFMLTWLLTGEVAIKGLRVVFPVINEL